MTTVPRRSDGPDLPTALAAFVFGLAGSLAGWTLLTWTAMALQLTPAALVRIWPLVLLVLAASAAGSAFLARSALQALVDAPGAGPDRTAQTVSRGRLLISGLFTLAGLTGIVVLQSPAALWAGCVAALLPWLRPAALGAWPAVTRPSWRWTDLAAILLSTAIIWGFNGMVALSNADDTHFLDAAASMIDSAALPLLATDTLFQVPERHNLVYALNLGQSWDVLAGYLAATTGLDLLRVYHAGLPALAAAWIPATWVLFARLCGVRAAGAGLLLALSVLLMSNLGGNMAATFLEHRLYQGKSVMILAGLPLAMTAGLLLARAPGVRATGLLAIVLVAAGGMSSTALYMAPLAAGLAAVAFVRWTPDGLARTATGLGVAVLPVLAAVIGFHVLGGTGDVMADYDYPPSRTLFNEFGGQRLAQAQLAFYHLAALGVAWLGAWRGRWPLLGLGAVVLVLGLNPWAGSWLGDLTGIVNLYWRFYWLVPIGVLLTLGAGTLLDEFNDAWRPGRGERWPSPTVPVAALLAAVMLFSPTSEPARYLLDGGRMHLSKAGPAAEAVIGWHEARPPGSGEVLLAAPETIAKRVNYFPGAPRQLYLRGYYHRLIPAELDTQRATIQRLVRILERQRITPRGARKALRLARELGVTHLVFWRARLVNENAPFGPQPGHPRCEPHSVLVVCATAAGATGRRSAFNRLPGRHPETAGVN